MRALLKFFPTNKPRASTPKIESTNIPIFLGIWDEDNKEDWGPYYKRVLCPAPMFRLSAENLLFFTFDEHVEFITKTDKAKKVTKIVVYAGIDDIRPINIWGENNKFLVDVRLGKSHIIFPPGKICVSIGLQSWQKGLYGRAGMTKKLLALE